MGGGGISGGMANNCTIVGNTAIGVGGGVGWEDSGGDVAVRTRLYNCIVYYNRALISSNAHRYAELENCCCPDVDQGVNGCITNVPELVSFSHLAPESPCIGAGRAEYSSGWDIDGEAWLDSSSMGCDEFHGTDSQLMRVAMDFNYIHPVAGHSVRFAAEIEGQPSMNVWDFGDGACVTNQILSSHVWEDAGTYDVILSAFYDGFPDGICATQTFCVVDRDATAVYVSPSGCDTNCGADWASAKATIQAGIETQEYDGGIVWVNEGTYALTNEIYVDRAVVVRSVDGPGRCIVDGQGKANCFSLCDVDCVVSGFTITNGYSFYGGAGVACGGSGPLVTNCVITGNKAEYYYGFGGGMTGGTLKDCLITGNYAYIGGGLFGVRAEGCIIAGNTAEDGGGVEGARMTSDGAYLKNCIISDNIASGYSGGGMMRATAVNCLISGNVSAAYGGGVYESSLYNCTVVSNTAALSGGGVCDREDHLNWPLDPDYGVAYNCVVWGNNAPRNKDLFVFRGEYNCAPDADHCYEGNTTNAPIFVDADHGDYRLMAGSPCINAGSNDCAVGAVDLNGYPRVVLGRVDLGAYEYVVDPADYDGDGLSNTEEGTLQTDSTLTDADGDGEDDGREVYMGFDPTAAASNLGFSGREFAGGYQLGFSTSTNHRFIVESRDSLMTGLWIERLGFNGTGAPFVFDDPSFMTNRFYRIRVETGNASF